MRLQFEVEERSDALLVPNGALRWTPVVHQVSPAYRSEFTSALRQKAAVNEKSKTRNHASGDKSVVNQGTVWVRDGDFVRPLSVTLGLTDGISTELIGGEVPDGTEVVVGIASNDDEIGASPFIPQIKNDKVKK